MKIQKNDVAKRLLSRLGYSEHDKSYQHHYAVALYVLDNFWEDKHDFTEVEEEFADKFVSAFPKTRDLYDKLIEISKKKITINRIVDSSAEHSGAADLTFQVALKQFDDYLERTGVICFADKQDFIKKEDLWRLGYSEQQLNGLKEVFKYCPLIKDDGDRYTWVYPTITNSLFALASVRDSRRDPVKDSNALVRNDANGKAYYPAPTPVSAKPKPWDLPVASASSQLSSSTNIHGSAQQGSAFRQSGNALPTSSLFHPQPINNELSESAAVTAFLAAHEQKLQSDKQSFFIRRTFVKKDWSLEQILQHAISDDNRSRSVCEQLGWLNKDGSEKDTAPEVIQSTIRSFANSFQRK